MLVLRVSLARAPRPPATNTGVGMAVGGSSLGSPVPHSVMRIYSATPPRAGLAFNWFLGPQGCTSISHNTLCDILSYNWEFSGRSFPSFQSWALELFPGNLLSCIHKNWILSLFSLCVPVSVQMKPKSLLLGHSGVKDECEQSGPLVRWSNLKQITSIWSIYHKTPRSLRKKNAMAFQMLGSFTAIKCGKQNCFLLLKNFYLFIYNEHVSKWKWFPSWCPNNVSQHTFHSVFLITTTTPTTHRAH